MASSSPDLIQLSVSSIMSNFLLKHKGAQKIKCVKLTDQINNSKKYVKSVIILFYTFSAWIYNNYFLYLGDLNIFTCLQQEFQIIWPILSKFFFQFERKF